MFNYSAKVLNLKKKKPHVVTSRAAGPVRPVSGSLLVGIAPGRRRGSSKKQIFLIRQNFFVGKKDGCSTKAGTQAGLSPQGNISLSPSRFGFFLSYFSQKTFVKKYRLCL